MQNDLPKWNNFVQRMKERRGKEEMGVELIKWLHGAHSASERVIGWDRLI